MKYILVKDLPPVFVPGADKEVFVKDGKVYINQMYDGLIGTLEDCLASGFVKEVKEKKKKGFWINVYYNDGNITTGPPLPTEYLAKRFLVVQDFAGTFYIEIEVEE